MRYLLECGTFSNLATFGRATREARTRDGDRPSPSPFPSPFPSPSLPPPPPPPPPHPLPLPFPSLPLLHIGTGSSKYVLKVVEDLLSRIEFVLLLAYVPYVLSESALQKLSRCLRRLLTCWLKCRFFFARNLLAKLCGLHLRRGRRASPDKENVGICLCMMQSMAAFTEGQDCWLLSRLGLHFYRTFSISDSMCLTPGF